MGPILPRRERLRAQAHAEIRTLAMAQVAAGGPSALSLTAIAREMGVSGPALYRYYASRDALLARLVADAFTDLADAIGRDVAGMAGGGPGDLLRTVAHAYRAWALAHVREYVLLTAGVPVDQPRADLETASRRALDLVGAGLVDLAPSASAAALAEAAPPAWLLPFSVTVWQRMHGHLSLELEGIHVAMGLDPAALYEDELGATVQQARRRWAQDLRAAPRAA